MTFRNDTADKVLTKYGIEQPRSGAWFGPGWVHIVEKLIEDLIEAGWDKNLTQVKEKFGGLRFYIGAGDDKIHSIIHAAENLSLRTCEDCGATGRNRIWHGGWHATLCEPCGKKAVTKFKKEESMYE